jgi:hypothetical protein
LAEVLAAPSALSNTISASSTTARAGTAVKTSATPGNLSLYAAPLRE